MSNFWPWPPNTLSESLEFSTDIRTSRSSEVREGLKDATESFHFLHTVSPEIAEKMVGAVEGDPHGLFGVPVWSLATFSSASLTIGQTEISIDDGGAYWVGQSVYIGQSSTDYEVETISVIDGNQITLSSGLVSGYPAGNGRFVVVAPVVDCLLPGGLGVSARFPVATISANFLSVEPSDLSLNEYPLHEGIPVVSDAAIPLSPLAGDFSQASNLSDTGFGFYSILATEEFSRRGGTATFSATTWAGKFKIRRFIHFMRGMDGESWFPTGQRNITLLGDISPASLSASVAPIMPADQIVGKSILIKEGDALSAVVITSAADISATEQSIGFSALGVSFTSLASVSLMHRCRFNSDTFGLSYTFNPGGMICRVSSKIIEVP